MTEVLSVGENDALIIQNVSRSDSDQYVCVGANMLGVVNISVNLKVVKRCEVNSISNNHHEFAFGMDISFSCNVEVMSA